MASLNIQVTQADIDEGHPLACASCPVALATSRAMHRPARVDAFITVVGYPRLVWSLPDAVYSFIKAFDAGLPVVPFSFVLEGV
jgi:hypothetical protein